MTIELKERLSFNDTKTFLSYYLEKLQNMGLIQPLETFSEISFNAELNDTIRSLFANLANGQTFQNSLKNMEIRFPDSVELLLINGFENSCLDIAIEEILDLLNYIPKNNNEIYLQLSLLVDKKLVSTNSDFICEECFGEEFFKLIQRVNIEKAYKVILFQENEDFFIQQFFGIKVVTYKEPSHSKTFQSFRSKISQQSENINIHDQKYKTTKQDDNFFLISSEDISFLIKFSDKSI